MKSLAPLLLAAAFSLPALAEDAARLRELGFKYYDGRAVKQDIAKGVALFERAAAAGDLVSQSNLCVMYEQAVFVELDYDRAAKWCAMAAERGDWPSQYRFGMLVYQGKGTARDPVEAVKWWHVMRLTLPDELLVHRRPTFEMTEAKLSTEQLAEARARAERWVATHPAGR